MGSTIRKYLAETSNGVVGIVGAHSTANGLLCDNFKSPDMKMEEKHKTLGKATDGVKERFEFGNGSFNLRYDLLCSHGAVYNDNFCAFRPGRLVARAFHCFRRHFLLIACTFNQVCFHLVNNLPDRRWSSVVRSAPRRFR